MITFIAGHLSGCGGADPHNSLTSVSSAFSEHFRIKQKDLPKIDDKGAAFHPHKHSCESRRD